jgi:hypothetical protein
MSKRSSKIGLAIAIVSFVSLHSDSVYAAGQCQCLIRTDVTGHDPVDDNLGKSEQNSQEACASVCNSGWALKDDAASIKGEYDDTAHTCECAIQTTLLMPAPPSEDTEVIPNTFPFYEVEGHVNSKEECTQACADWRIPHNTASIVGIYTPQN